MEALESGAADESGTNKSSIERGILFLLRNQDRYGIWYSTQATINVLRALAASVSAPASARISGSQATVLVDGKPAASIALPPGNELSAPVLADLSKYLGAGDHRIEISRAPGASEASVQLAESYYVPWSSDSEREGATHEKGSAESLRLVVNYDKTKARIGEQINCTVKAERVDFHGYGMMLAEIGLPPGAEVDRDSLDKAMTASGWDINHFDVLPDRVIVYLWPALAALRFHLRLRLALASTRKLHGPSCTTTTTLMLSPSSRPLVSWQSSATPRCQLAAALAVSAQNHVFVGRRICEFRAREVNHLRT